MIIAKFVSKHNTMSDTKTAQDFYKYLGQRPHRLGVVSRLYPELTASYLTEALKNIIYNDSKSSNKYQNINSMAFEWEVETNFIKRIEFAAVPQLDGANGTSITMAFREKYYDKQDIVKIDKTGQLFRVMSYPVRKADNYVEYEVRLIDNDYSSILDKSGCQVGDFTHFVSNAVPTELHREGFVKSQSKILILLLVA